MNLVYPHLLLRLVALPDALSMVSKTRTRPVPAPPSLTPFTAPEILRSGPPIRNPFTSLYTITQASVPDIRDILLDYHSRDLLGDTDALIRWIEDHLKPIERGEGDRKDEVMQDVKPHYEGDIDERIDVCDGILLTDP
jgi:hypothetical protein